MNAGKTTTLLQASYNYNERGMGTLLFIPAFYENKGTAKIESRIGIHSQANCFNQEFSFYHYIEEAVKSSLKKVKCIMVDEAQFLTKDQVSELCDVVDFLKLPVLCYGLRTNFMGEPFEGSQYLLSWADELSEIKGVCHCGSKAIMTLRTDGNGTVLTAGDEVSVDKKERYISTCRKHFKQKVAFCNDKEQSTDRKRHAG